MVKHPMPRVNPCSKHSLVANANSASSETSGPSKSCRVYGPVTFQASSSATAALFLVTSRLIYEENHLVFYGYITFWLPLGDLQDAVYYFDRLKPDHKLLVKLMGIKFGCLPDLVPLTIESHGRLMTDISLRWPIQPTWSGITFAHTLLYEFTIGWEAKLKLLHQWKSIEVVRCIEETEWIQ